MKIHFKLSTSIIFFAAFSFFMGCKTPEKQSSYTQIILQVSLDKQFPNANIATIINVLKNRIEAAEY